MRRNEEYKKKIVSMQEAAKQIRSGDFVGVGLGIGACSSEMFDAVLDRWEELKDVTISDTVPCTSIQALRS
jgi:4-hydroxybutyrate CoA-transferase